MATLTDKYAVPVSVAWTDTLTNAGTVHTMTAASVPASGLTAAICWISSYKTFQVQWRMRARKSPAAAILDDPTGADVWTDWGSWQGADIDQDQTTPVTQLSNGRVRVTATETWTYDVTATDLIEYEVRVRVINTPDLTVSDWAYATLPVMYSPTLALTSCEESPDGCTVTMDASWPRGLSSLRTSLYAKVYSETATTQIDGATYQRADGTSTATWTEPSKHIVDYNGSKAVLCTVQALTTDGADVAISLPTFANKRVLSVGAHTPSSGVSIPTVTTEPAGDALAVTVTPSGADWDSVMASVVWTDGMGRAGQVDATVADHTGTTWTLEAFAPPFDVELEVRVAVVKGAGWRSATETVTIPSNGRASFCHMDAGEVAIEYDLTHSQTIEPEAEVVQLADGRTVERRGLGCLRQFDVEGRYVTDDHDQGYFKPLRQLAGWVLRLPEGIRCRVAVQEVAVSTDAAYKLRAVSVQCTEVDDG